jgi:hypothetical protein
MPAGRWLNLTSSLSNKNLRLANGEVAIYYFQSSEFRDDTRSEATRRPTGTGRSAVATALSTCRILRSSRMHSRTVDLPVLTCTCKSVCMLNVLVMIKDSDSSLHLTRRIVCGDAAIQRYKQWAPLYMNSSGTTIIWFLTLSLCALRFA